MSIYQLADSHSRREQRRAAAKTAMASPCCIAAAIKDEQPWPVRPEATLKAVRTPRITSAVH